MTEARSAQEALWRLGPKAVLSHEEAARRHGIELVEDDGTLRATVPRNRSRASVPGWNIARADTTPAEVVVLDHAPVTTPLRTVADLARVLPLDHAVAAADSALRQRLVTVATLVLVLGSAKGRGARRLRACASLLDPLSGSVLESMLRVLMHSAGLPPPRTQYVVATARGRQVARVDFCWPALKLIVEADGFAFHSDRASYRADRARMNELEVLGWRVLRFTWEDVLSRPTYVVATIRACMEQPQAA